MHEFLMARPALAYTWFWIWLALVSAGTLFVYKEIAGLAGMILSSVLGLGAPPGETAAFGLDVAPWLEQAILYVAGILIWWRVTKVVVLHGAPLSLGMKIASGRQDEGKTGRLATLVHIGDHDVYGDNYDGKFYYGAVFRAHPNSDKLMRSRVELLVLYIPILGSTLSVHESRIFIRKRDHEGRGKIFRLVSDQYSQKTK